VTRRPRLDYLDTLRLALTALVVVHHTLITYGASGSWFYVEPRDWTRWAFAGSVVTAANQLYFMGLFFLIAGYFTPAAYDRKGPWRFLVDRVVRLGLPLALAYVLASPYLELMKSRSLGEATDGYWHELAWRFRAGELSPGPLWFVEALLAFSVLYAAGRAIMRSPGPRAPRDVGHGELLLLAAAIAASSIAIRIRYPSGTEVAHLQLAWFGQYTVLFAAGVWAARRDVLARLRPRLVAVWGPAAVVAFVGLGVLAEASGGLPKALPLLAGGLRWQAAVAAVLESIYCVGAIVTLLVAFRDHVPATRLTSALASDAYAVYILHAPVLVAITFAMRPWAAPPPLKALVAIVMTLAACFATSHLVLRRSRAVKRVL
jgi:glucans biosynthesis protein C